MLIFHFIAFHNLYTLEIHCTNDDMMKMLTVVMMVATLSCAPPFSGYQAQYGGAERE